MFRSGSFVSGAVTPVGDDQVQPNGVDLTVEAVLEPTGTGRIDRTGTTVGDRAPIDSEDGVYRLGPGAYVARYGEVVAVPSGHVGFVYPRSSLMRNGCMLHTAVWDAGYEGRGEGLLEVHRAIELETGARIGQLVLAEAGQTGAYDGRYQGENR